MTTLRTSQEVEEVLSSTDPKARVSQQSAEVLGTAGADARASQQVAESLSGTVSSAKVTQQALEALGTAVRNLLATQVVVEVLLANVEREVPLPIYPDQSVLPGLGYNVKWSPQFFNMPTTTTTSGADIDLALADTPLHDFELTYDFLRDGALQNTGSSEFKTMFGFFLRIGGAAGRFAFLNPDDNSVTGQSLGLTDGTSSNYLIQRTFGVGDNSGTEPVGVVDVAFPPTVYLDGVVQDPGTYAIDTADACNNQVKFTTTPAAGKALAIDIPRYRYYCKFPDNSATFEKFMNRLWLLNKITLHSCRPGA